MADQFGPHDRKYGARLEQIQRLGRRGGLRFVEAEPPARAKEVMPLETVYKSPRSAPSEGARRSGPKGGRPGLGKPWEAEGISRAVWFRRKKGAGNG